MDYSRRLALRPAPPGSTIMHLAPERIYIQTPRGNMSRAEREPPDAGLSKSAHVAVDLTDQIRFLERRLRAAPFEQFDTDEVQALEYLLATIRGLVSPTDPD